jgi:NADH-quinone oxidoreductase subunit I
MDPRLRGQGNLQADGAVSYFRNIYEAVTTVAKGMRITLRTFFSTPVTIQYPEEDILGSFVKYVGPLSPAADRFRGFLTVEIPICIACDLCANTCPISCIKIEGIRIEKRMITGKSGKETPKVKEAVKFEIDFAKCMYCGLCVEPCTTGAIYFTREFAGAVSDITKLKRNFAGGEAVKA